MNIQEILPISGFNQNCKNIVFIQKQGGKFTDFPNIFYENIFKMKKQLLIFIYIFNENVLNIYLKAIVKYNVEFSGLRPGKQYPLLIPKFKKYYTHSKLDFSE